MGRPANTDSADTRKRVLTAARKLFSAHGESGVSVREVAAAAKVTAATVLHHFGSKEKLYEATVAAMDEELASVRDRIAPILMNAGDLPAAVEQGVRAVFRVAREHQPAIRLLLRHVIDTGEIGSTRREKQLLPYLELGAKLFAAQSGRAEVEIRLAMQSAVFLVGRWAITSPREAAAIAGIRGEAAWQAVEDHLVDVIRMQLLSPRSPS